MRVENSVPQIELCCWQFAGDALRNRGRSDEALKTLNDSEQWFVREFPPGLPNGSDDAFNDSSSIELDDRNSIWAKCVKALANSGYVQLSYRIALTLPVAYQSEAYLCIVNASTSWRQRIGLESLKDGILDKRQFSNAAP
jgi:hypothetical protein